MSAISIIMPCYNRAYDILKVLRGYELQETAESYDLIAIDDASSDDTVATLTSYQPKRYSLTVLRQEKNQGPAAARNRGIAAAQAPLILFVGDDIIPDSNFVAAHLEAHRKHPEPEIAILGHVTWGKDLPQNTLMTHIDGKGAEQFSYYYFRDGQEYDFRHLYTANISLKTDFLKSLDKWFDTDFPFAAFEDVELAYRLSKRGLRILYSAAPLGYHYHYHNIWTFSVRQYRSGLMACVLAKKHPQLLTLLKGNGWALKALKGWLEAVFLPAPSGSADRLEAQLLHLASAYEWAPAVPNTVLTSLDELYIRLLNYFYRKGLFAGSFRDPVLLQRIQDRNANQVLGPLLAWFVHESQKARAALPEGGEPWVLLK